jgi:hypothetical protein
MIRFEYILAMLLTKPFSLSLTRGICILLRRPLARCPTFGHASSRVTSLCSHCCSAAPQPLRRQFRRSPRFCGDRRARPGVVRRAARNDICTSPRMKKIRLGLLVRSDVAFPLHFEVRVVEALSYVLARPMAWRTLNTCDGNNDVLYLSSPRRQSTNTQLGRPLSGNQIGHQSMVWRLFSKYLEYAYEAS